MGGFEKKRGQNDEKWFLEKANFKLTVLRAQKELAVQISQGFESYQIVLISSYYIDLALLHNVLVYRYTS